LEFAEKIEEKYFVLTIAVPTKIIEYEENSLQKGTNLLSRELQLSIKYYINIKHAGCSNNIFNHATNSTVYSQLLNKNPLFFLCIWHLSKSNDIITSPLLITFCFTIFFIIFII